jgi:hypothetical protein
MTCLLLNQHTSSPKTDASCSSETSVSSRKSAQCHNPVDHNHNICRCFTECYISYHDTWLNEIEVVMDHGMAQAVDHRFLPRRPGFYPRSSYVGFVMGKVTLGQVFSEYFGFSYQSLFYQLTHIHYLPLIDGIYSHEASSINNHLKKGGNGKTKFTLVKLHICTSGNATDIEMAFCISLRSFIIS